MGDESVLNDAPEQRILRIENKFLGHWVVSQNRCAGFKCLEWAPVGCSKPCEWSSNGACEDRKSNGDLIEVRVQKGDLAQYWAGSIQQMEIEKALEKWANNKV